MRRLVCIILSISLFMLAGCGSFAKSNEPKGSISNITDKISNGIYFMDEPEAALSPQRQLTLLMEIDRCRKEGAQFFIVTHSPIILGLPDAEILTFDDGIIHQCEYEETESYQVTSMFINDRKQILK